MVTSYLNTRLARAAISYAERQRWRIFPLPTRKKEPPPKDFPTIATNDVDRVRQLWTINPHRNIAVLCGDASGIVGVDIDPRSGGTETWAELLDIHGQMADTLSAISGSGGTHYYFQSPPGIELHNTQGTLGPGIDIRAWHGYMVLPPSVHPSGGVYEWDSHVPPAPLPDWLLEKWRQFIPAVDKPDKIGEPLPPNLQAFVADQCRAWGLKQLRTGEYAGPCPHPHLNGPCECPKAFYVTVATGFWRCFCSNHPKTPGKLVATGWVVSGRKPGYRERPPGGHDQPRKVKGRVYLPRVEVQR